MKRAFLPLIAALGVVIMMSLTSCNPENVLARALEGDWEVKSYTIDGEELIGFTVTSFDMEFEEYDGDEGDFNFDLVNSNGQTSNFRGEYSLNSDGDELDLTYNGGDIEMWDISIDGDDMELEANFDGVRYVIDAEKD